MQASRKEVKAGADCGAGAPAEEETEALIRRGIQARRTRGEQIEQARMLQKNKQDDTGSRSNAHGRRSKRCPQKPQQRRVSYG